MKATIDLPDELYRRVKAKSALQGRPVRAVAMELFQRWLDEDAPAPSQSPEKSRAEWLDDWMKLADEAFKNAPSGSTARENLERDRSRLERSPREQLEAWRRLGEEHSRNAPPGPTRTEILEADRNRLERP